MAVIDPDWAWQTYEPSAQNPWNLQKVGHLYRRAALGARWDELQQGLQLGPHKLIDRLLRGGEQTAEFDRETHAWGQTIRTANNGTQAPAWWLWRMLRTPHPLREKMTLFWHNHFATSNAKVRNAAYMLGQYDLLYKYALGSFASLLQEISKDPAMMLWLDTVQSKKGMPNENYARELMELFSLGIGNYTESDIREAARALTGWEIRSGHFYLNKSQQDTGSKTVFKQTGHWSGEDIVRLCLEKDACSLFIIRKLFRFLIGENCAPTPALLNPLAQEYRHSYETGKIVEKIIRSNLFFSANSYRGSIKSPVDFIVSIVRAFEAQIGSSELARDLETLGQNLLNPPSVKGWDGGQAWLNSQTLLYRQNLALRLCDHRVSNSLQSGGSLPLPVALVRKLHCDEPGAMIDLFLKLFVDNVVPPETRARLVAWSSKTLSSSYPLHWSPERRSEHRIITACHLILTLPEFQLN